MTNPFENPEKRTVAKVTKYTPLEMQLLKKVAKDNGITADDYIRLSIKEKMERD